MIEAPTPHNEAERMAALNALSVLYTPSEERFDRITRLCRNVFDVPIALVSLVGKDQQWFKSACGLNDPETPRSVSFCGHAIMGEDTFVVNDSRQDERFHDNPMVTGHPHIGFYAGQPIIDGQGHKLGTLCLFDHQPKEFDQKNCEILRELTGWVESELSVAHLNSAQEEMAKELDETKRKASVDALTKVWNRGAIMDLLTREASRAERERRGFGVIMTDVDHFKSVNDNYGHQAGDEVLREVSRRIRSAARPQDAVGRYGGEEFMVVAEDCGIEQTVNTAERMRRAIERQPVALADGQLQVTASFGVGYFVPASDNNPEKVLGMADTALYKAKESGRNRVMVNS